MGDYREGNDNKVKNVPGSLEKGELVRDEPQGNLDEEKEEDDEGYDCLGEEHSAEAVLIVVVYCKLEYEDRHQVYDDEEEHCDVDLRFGVSDEERGRWRNGE